MIDKRVDSVAQALADVPDGATILVGGFGTAGIPDALIDGLIDQGARDLTIVNNNAGNGDTGLAALLKTGRVLMTRSRGPVEFLLDRHRLNVALSRVRDAVIILAHRRCLTRSRGGPFDRLLEIGRREDSLDCIVVTNDMRWDELGQHPSFYVVT